MFKILVKQEIKALLKSKRVIWSLAIFLILYATVFMVRVNDYDNRVQSYIKDVASFGDQSYEELPNYSYIDIPVIRKPSLYSIFNEGDTHKRGTIYNVEPFKEVRNPEVRNQSTNLLFKEPANLDITFLITFFFSLFVLLITFDSVNQEKEDKILRLLFSYPIKRSVYITKKMVGSMFFIALVFLVPYLLSVVYLFFAYHSVIDVSFAWFLIYYGLVALICLFSIALIGIFTSLVTTSPTKSLIYALSIWILLIMVIPTSYEFIADKAFEDKQKTTILQENYNSLRNDKIYDRDNIDESMNPNTGSHWSWNNGFEKDLHVIAEDATNDKHLKYLQHYYNEIYPKIQEQEKISEQLLRLSTKGESVKPLWLCFLPNVQFKSAANLIAMNSTEDFIDFRQDAIALRNSLINVGIKDGWLLSKSYFSAIDTTYSLMGFNDYLFSDEVAAKMKVHFQLKSWNEEEVERILDEIGYQEFNNQVSWFQEDYYAMLIKSLSQWGKVDMDTSNIPKYSPKELNPLIVLQSIWKNLAFMLSITLVMFIVNVNIFSQFDLR